MVQLVKKDRVQSGILEVHKIKIRTRNAAVYLYRGHIFNHILAIIEQFFAYYFLKVRYRYIYIIFLR
jgi:hypothetical protein